MDVNRIIDLGGKDAENSSARWQFAYSSEPPEDEFTSIKSLQNAGLVLRDCTVPGNFELDLLEHGLIPEPYYGMNVVKLREFERMHVWYARTFVCNPSAECYAEIVFDGLDCFAKVFLNGEHIGSSDNMLIEHHFDITGKLRDNNELVVHIRPAVVEAEKFDYPPQSAANKLNYESLYVRKAPHMYGWDIMPRIVSAGIWRPVWIHMRPDNRIKHAYLQTVHLSPEHRQAILTLNYDLKLNTPSSEWIIRTEGCSGESRFEHTDRLMFSAGRWTFELDNPRLWYPKGYGSPDLYDVTVTLEREGEVHDTLHFRHGIRMVELHRTAATDADGSGEFCLQINGEKVFAKGACWVPADAFHSRDRGRIRKMISLVCECNCNILRCWGGNVYEDELFYRLCDEHGLMIWQDFSMACAVYPQSATFQRQLEREARSTVKRLRQHSSIVLWCGDNECDDAYRWYNAGDPNNNVLTRAVLPAILREEDPHRPFLPSSPCAEPETIASGIECQPEQHLWGPRGYFKDTFYSKTNAHFVSEIGYHGCPATDSIRRFISPDNLWRPPNGEWNLHSTSPVPGTEIFAGKDYRIKLMFDQIRELFGNVPDSLDDFVFASQATQAEANKFFIELFRSGKWRRTGIIWWNLIDGWPQFSDAVVDYYFQRKLAFDFITRSQQDPLVMLAEPENGRHKLIACNDTLNSFNLTFSVADADRGKVLEDTVMVPANQSVPIGEIPHDAGTQRFYIIDWTCGQLHGRNHYLAGIPPFDLERYRRWLFITRLMPLQDESGRCK